MPMILDDSALKGRLPTGLVNGMSPNGTGRTNGVNKPSASTNAPTLLHKFLTSHKELESYLCVYLVRSPVIVVLNLRSEMGLQ